MDMQKYSSAGKTHILKNWMDMYAGAAAAGDTNGIIRQCTTSFPGQAATVTASAYPSFTDRMRVNLRAMGVNKAFTVSMQEVFFGMVRQSKPKHRGRTR